MSLIGVVTEPIILALAERVQELLPGRAVATEQVYWDDHLDYVPSVTVDSCYHRHVILLVNSTIEMQVQHKHRKKPLKDITYEYDLNDPNSLDDLLEEIERTSEHAP